MLSRRGFGLAAAIAGVAGAGAMRWFDRGANAETGEVFEITHTEEEWREMLTPQQFDVLREHGTERAGTSPLDHESGPVLSSAPAATCPCSRPRPSTTAAPAGRVFGRPSTTRSARPRTTAGS